MKRLTISAAAVLLAALAACADYSSPVSADVAPSSSGATSEAGPGGVIGTGYETTTTADSTTAERGPGTFGSGH